MSHFLDRLTYFRRTREKFSDGHGITTDESREWEDRVAESLGQEPGTDEEAECTGERSFDLQEPGEAHDQSELEQPERESGPAGLVRDEPVVGRVEREPDPEHQSGELHRPPGLQRQAEHAGDEERREGCRDPGL